MRDPYPSVRDKVIDKYGQIYDILSYELPGWAYLYAEEQVAITLRTVAFMAQAYDEAFADCEEQGSGFAPTTNWTNNNPYPYDAETS